MLLVVLSKTMKVAVFQRGFQGPLVFGDRTGTANRRPVTYSCVLAVACCRKPKLWLRRLLRWKALHMKPEFLKTWGHIELPVWMFSYPEGCHIWASFGVDGGPLDF